MRRIAVLVFAGILSTACSESADLVTPRGFAVTHAPAIGATTADGITRIDLGTLGGSSSFATAINNAGDVVGWSQTGTGVMHAFLWTEANGMIDLGTLPGDLMSQAVSVRDGNGGAMILGVSGDGFNWRPVTWSSSGAATPLPIPLLAGAYTGQPTDFNARGQVVGWDILELQHGWFWSASGKFDITALGANSFEGIASRITANGLVVGTTNAFGCTAPVGDCWHTFLWSQNGGYRDIGVPFSEHNRVLTGASVNESGTVVGWTAPEAGGLIPYSWNELRGFTLLPTLATTGGSGFATDVNVSGTAVGLSRDPQTGLGQAVLWPASGGIVRLSATATVGDIAIAINAPGRVAGWTAAAPGVNHAMLWIPGPGAQLATVSAAATTPLESTSCLSDRRALVSRTALFNCVSGAARIR
jgi:probable HAF family extracellular repeat protein